MLPNRLLLERLHAAGKQHVEILGNSEEICSLVSAFDATGRLLLITSLGTVPVERKSLVHQLLAAQLDKLQPAYVQLVMEGWYVELQPGEQPTVRPSEDPRRRERITVATGSQSLDMVVMTDYTVGHADDGTRILTLSTEKHTSWFASQVEGGLWHALFPRA